jgi:hypothetical protein
MLPPSIGGHFEASPSRSGPFETGHRLLHRTTRFFRDQLLEKEGTDASIRMGGEALNSISQGVFPVARLVEAC